MYLSKLSLRNIRALRDVTLSFEAGAVGDPPEPRMITVILGANGTCKTSLLRAIVLGLSREEEGNALVAEAIGRLVTEDSKEATIEAELRSRDRERWDSATTQIRNDSIGDLDVLFNRSGHGTGA